MLFLQNITKNYVTSTSNSKPLAVLNRYSGQFSNKRQCIVGDNGSGKTTLLLTISGLLTVDSGTIQWQGKAISQTARKQKFAIASDSIIIPEFLTAKQVIDLNAHISQVEWPENLIDLFNFSSHVNKSINALSAGNLKKLQLISAFMRETDLLLLDEPNIALDEQSVKTLWKLLETFPGMIIVASNEPVLFERHSFDLRHINADK